MSSASAAATASEAFVNTLRRDYLDGADLSSAARVLEQFTPKCVSRNRGQSSHRYKFLTEAHEVLSTDTGSIVT